MKKWWQSKLLLLGVLQIVGAIAEYLAGLPVGVSIGQVISGILTIILRMLPTLPIEGSLAAKAMMAKSPHLIAKK